MDDDPNGPVVEASFTDVISHPGEGPPQRNLTNRNVSVGMYGVNTSRSVP